MVSGNRWNRRIPFTHLVPCNPGVCNLNARRSGQAQLFHLLQKISLSIEDFDLLRVIGKGSFGKVRFFLCRRFLSKVETVCTGVPGQKE